MDIFNKIDMKDLFGEIEGYENKTRKQKAFKQLDVYSGNQDKYIYYKIQQMYGKEAIETIQAITGINLAARIADAEASIYKECPTRRFTNATEKEQEQIDVHYEQLNADLKLMMSNRLYRLGNQCQLQVIPKNGKLMGRVLYQHQYDVVPMTSDPDKAYMYIIPLQATKTDRQDTYNLSDNINQVIADKNDADLSRNKYIIWTAEYNFMCNGLGQILNPETEEIMNQFTDEDIKNPIGMLPFIDISKEKTMGFYAGGGQELSDFSVTFGVILSDLGEIVKLQGYSQGVLSSLEEPKSLSIGPHRALWLKKDKNEPGDKDPSFQFVSPSPDLTGSMNYAENILRMFLSSRGSDNKLVTTKDTSGFSSGFERLLAMVDRAEATKGDKHLFHEAEEELFDIIRAWNNYLFDTTDGLTEENKISKISEEVELEVQFSEPSQVMTQAEKEASVEKRMDLGLLSRDQALVELYGVSEDKALEMRKEIDASEVLVDSNEGLIGKISE